MQSKPIEIFCNRHLPQDNYHETSKTNRRKKN